jgi:hypothetical protein
VIKFQLMLCWRQCYITHMQTSSSLTGSNAARDTRIYNMQQFIAVLAAFVALKWQLYWVLSSSYNYCIFQCLTLLFDLLACSSHALMLSSTLTAAAFNAQVLYQQGCLELV